MPFLSLSLRLKTLPLLHEQARVHLLEDQGQVAQSPHHPSPQPAHLESRGTQLTCSQPHAKGRGTRSTQPSPTYVLDTQNCELNKWWLF